MERYKVLVVDDEINILNTLKRLLRSDDLEVLITTSQGVALDHLRNSEIALILSDQKMPHMEGTHLLEQARSLSPKTIRIMVTGYADTQTAMKAINIAGVHRFLTKPWIDAELITIVREAGKTYATTVKSGKLLNLLVKRGELAPEDSLDEEVSRHLADSLKDLSRWEETARERPPGVIEMMRKTLHFHGPEISAHCQRVAELCVRIGNIIGLKVQESMDLEIAASLHDIGKIGLPEEVLKLPETSLSDYQLKLLNTHPKRGAELLSQIPGMQAIARIIAHHHEAYDGSGFPSGLLENTIPLASRILFVADQYDKALSGKVEEVDAVPGHVLQYLESDLLPKLDSEVLKALKECIIVQKPAKEINVQPRDLIPGMVLTRELRTAADVLLFAEFTELTPFHIEIIQERQDSDPILGGVFIQE